MQFSRIQLKDWEKGFFIENKPKQDRWFPKGAIGLISHSLYLRYLILIFIEQLIEFLAARNDIWMGKPIIIRHFVH